MTRRPRDATRARRASVPGPGRLEGMSSFVLEASGLVKAYGQTRALAAVHLREEAGAQRATVSTHALQEAAPGKSRLLPWLVGVVAGTHLVPFLSVSDNHYTKKESCYERLFTYV